MKRLLIAVVLGLALAGTAYAYKCTTTTYYGPDGSIVICTTCCDSFGNCTVTCY